MNMKKILFLVVVLLVASVVSANAGQYYFAQDDFTLTFGAQGQPGAAGGTFTATGYIKQWTANTAIAWFSLTGKTTAGAAPVGTQYLTTYDLSTLTIYAGLVKGNTTTTLWAGNGWLNTLVNADASTFTPNIQPWYETQPVQYNSIGSADFMATSTSGTFTSPEFVAQLGTYNWSYDNVTPALRTTQFGNTQGKLEAVPEPMSVMLGIMGLGSVAGFMKLRRK